MERKIMELIEKLTNELDLEINRVWQDYVDLHTELAPHCDQPINDNVDEINRLLKGIQEKFALLWPAYNFIAVRHQSVTNAVTFYNDFIERLKKSGAKQNEPEAPTIIEG